MISRTFAITLVRHGETLSNRENIMQGQLDTELSDLGYEQARLVAAKLQDDTFTNMYSSDLRRASETARAIASANRVSSCELKLDKRLRERCFGFLEGKPFREFQRVVSERNVSPSEFTPEGGETVAQVTQRARSFFNDLCKLMVDPSGAKRKTCTGTNGQTSPGNSPCCVTKSSDSEGQAVTSSSEVMKDSRQVKNGDRISQSGIPSDGQGSSSGRSSSTTALQISIPESDGAGVATDNGTGSVGCSVRPEASEDPQSGVANVSSDESLQADGDLVLEDGHVLIASHGLLLRELKSIILQRFKGQLHGNNALEAKRISPNTGVSRFVLTACTEGPNKLHVNCVEVCVINDTSHLTGVGANLVSHAKFQGAL
ncbi:fructose-2,6-bisphosphatase TIGAR [Aplysia californica]|uniref:Fructose-2,6-bisphosphatase TIGAR n=1 Tax=Aplysia californica TaxID=6500 RepID=A0ABM0JPB1_APLCA|nr:fructose-2,6-bisphosphatase TIGAR [Aplysia californica]